MTDFAHERALRYTSLTNTALVVLFIVGIYLGIDFRISQGVPVPAVIAGIAGLLLLLVNSDQITRHELTALALVVILYLVSILCAEGGGLLGERFKGLVQISYSLTIGYGLFLALKRFNRDTLARLLLAFCSIIVVGCVLETHTGLRDISDAFRHRVFESGIYVSDLRDQYLYGGIRPKLFTSEPSIVTFSFTLFLFAWYVVSHSRLKLPVYLLYLAVGLVYMRGPTLLIGAAVILPYQFFLASRRDGPGGATYDGNRLIVIVAATVILGSLLAVFAQATYAERLDEILSGRDSSFFARIIAPVLTARTILLEHPFAGAGLAGWEFIDPIIKKVYATSWGLSLPWQFGSASESLTNYFWSHWIFLGLVWGAVMLVALSSFARAIGIPSLAFVWVVWFAFGNAAGAYVSPRTWTVFFLAGAIALLHQREAPRLFHRILPDPGHPRGAVSAMAYQKS